ncbi:MAG: 50S ribosomal protein L31 [Firmicutes bacterium]|nr:50S ribosomal protein L31 [Bacillota bacterium]
MKNAIQPKVYLATVTCTCGNSFQTLSTKPEVHVDICNKCHPLYTGQQRFVDTGGRVEKFKKKYGLS